MKIWTFKCYLDASGTDVIDEWYNAQTPAVQAAFDGRIQYLEQQPSTNWKDPHFHTLTGPCSGLGEIRFKADRVQHRILGFFGPGNMEYTLVFPATEKGDKLKPKAACKLALARKKDVIDDPERAHECEF